MTDDEAMSILGIAAPCEGEAVRRAYLRAIKLHSPERDAAGFQRVRMAYERLRHGAMMFAPPSPELASPDPALPTTDAAPPAEAKFDRLAALRVRIESELVDEAVVAEVRSLVREEPSAEAYRLWLETTDLLHDDDAETGRAIVREALARGYREFEESARFRCPDLLSDAQLAAWREEFETTAESEATTLAWALIDRGEAAAATEVALRGAERARERFQPWNGWFWAEFGLALFARGSMVEGARWAAAAPSEGSMRDPTLRSTMLRELARVAPKLPDAVVIALASALRAHDPASADAPLALFAGGHFRAALAARRLLKREAPTLFQLFGAALRSVRLSGLFPEKGYNWYMIIGVQVILALTRASCRHCSDSETPSSKQPSSELREEQAETQRAPYLGALRGADERAGSPCAWPASSAGISSTLRAAPFSTSGPYVSASCLGARDVVCF